MLSVQECGNARPKTTIYRLNDSKRTTHVMTVRYGVACLRSYAIPRGGMHGQAIGALTH